MYITINFLEAFEICTFYVRLILGKINRIDKMITSNSIHDSIQRELNYFTPAGVTPAGAKYSDHYGNACSAALILIHKYCEPIVRLYASRYSTMTFCNFTVGSCWAIFPLFLYYINVVRNFTISAVLHSTADCVNHSSMILVILLHCSAELLRGDKNT